MLHLFTPNRRFEDPMAEMERQLGMGGSVFNPAHWGRDITSRETASLAHPVRRQEDGSYKMEVYLDVHRFKPDEVSVTTKDGVVIVEAAQERNSDDGAFHSAHHLKRSFAIPRGVEKKDITAHFTPDGGVLIQAPANPPEPQPPQHHSALNHPAPLPVKHH